MKLLNAVRQSGYIALTALLLSGSAQAQTKLKHLDTNLSFEERTEALIAAMTADEKISQLQHDAVAIPRLQIPEYNWWNESLHGVAFAGKATVFPQPIGLASSFNPELIHRLGGAISDEARAKHHQAVADGKREIFHGLTFFAPNINIFRDPRWGRGSETYGEDPYLTGRLGVAYIKGLQGDDPKYLKLAATAKHYAVHSGPEATRHSFNAVVNDKDLYETYLPHFKEAVQEAKVASVMSAYNRVNGASSSGDQRILTDILRTEWGFNGYVVSDCWAVLDIFENHKIAYSAENAVEIALKSGTDLNCGNYYKKHLTAAYKQGLVSDADLDKALQRTFLTRFKLGMFDADENVTYAQIDPAVINSAENQALALQAAQESIVLLKNKDRLLPLKKSVKTIAVIGPNADQIEPLLGNYHGLPFQYVTPLEGIKKRAPEGTKVLYAAGSDWAKTLPVLEPMPASLLSSTYKGKKVTGLVGQYFINNRLRGDLDALAAQENKEAEIIYEGKPLITQLDPEIKFNWEVEPAVEGLPKDYFNILWEGDITVDEAGEYFIGAEGHNKYKIFIDGEEVLAHYEGYHENIKVSNKYDFKAQKAYKVRIEFEGHIGAANFRLLWAPVKRDLLAEAVAVAKQSDVVVMAVGLTPRLEAEGSDRTSIVLPEMQQTLIKEIAKTGKPVVLVMLNGGQLAVNWEQENLPAIIEAWYPGQAGGDAIASVLFGDYNPSGRLPITVYTSLDELPHFGNYSMVNRTYRYYTGKALYPFGYGLSYSQFAYDNLRVPNKGRVGKTVRVSVDVKNTSKVDGTEVVQLYIKNVSDAENQPQHSLKGVKRIKLGANESKTVKFDIAAKHFSFVNDKGESVSNPGDFVIAIGGGQPGLTSETTQSVSGKLTLKR